MRRDAAQYTGSYQLNNKQRINANVFYADLFYETPGGLTPAELAANPRQARPAAGAFPGAITQNSSIHVKTIYTGLSHEINLSSRWSNTTGIYGSYSDFQNPNIRNYEKRYEKGIGGRTVFKYTNPGFTGTMGGELQQGYFNTAVHGNRAGVKDSLQFRAGLDSRQVNVFAQADVNLPAGLILNAGISYNNYYYNYEKTAGLVQKKESSSFEPQVVPRVSLLKKIKAASVYVSVSKGYSVPGIDEVFAGNDEFNKALKPETAVNYELGVKGDIIKNKLWLDAAYYIFSLKNTIVSRRDSGGGDFYTNAGNTR
jgi:iron complex outermembrane receptor protein